MVERFMPTLATASLDHGIAVDASRDVGIRSWLGRMHACTRREASLQAPGNAVATPPPAIHGFFCTM